MKTTINDQDVWNNQSINKKFNLNISLARNFYIFVMKYFEHQKLHHLWTENPGRSPQFASPRFASRVRLVVRWVVAFVPQATLAKTKSAGNLWGRCSRSKFHLLFEWWWFGVPNKMPMGVIGKMYVRCEKMMGFLQIIVNRPKKIKWRLEMWIIWRLDELW